MISEFDKYIFKLMTEADLPSVGDSANDAVDQNESVNNDPTSEDGMSDDLMNELPETPEKPVFPEELELAKLAIRALYFNKDSKDVHNLKLKVDNQSIPFEKISDFFEKTKKIIPILSFVEWVMDKYEGLASKWSEQPEVKGKSIKDKLKYFVSLPEEERLDNGKRVYWARIILNCLLNGTPNTNINISDVNEKNIEEVFRFLKQHFGQDSRGMMQPDVKQNLEGPGVF